jgi:hypothetical protein
MANPNQIVKIAAEIKLGSDPFANAPVLTAIGEAVKSAQEQIAGSGGDTTANFAFNVTMEAEKAPRKAKTPPATPPAAAAAAQPAAPANGAKS